MGATGWAYFGPYQPDMARALDDLRRDVLARRDYAEPGLEIDILDDMGFFEAEGDERERMMAEYGLEPLRWAVERFGMDGLRAWLESQQPSSGHRGPRPRSMEELEALRCVSMSGTHSILDISGINSEPTSGAISPVPEGTLVEFFGTVQPTRGMVEAWRQRRDLTGESPFERSQGIFLTVYKDGRPDEIYVEGASGD